MKRLAPLPPPERGRILAGGTDLLVQMRAGAVRPALIVDIKKIAEMTDDRGNSRWRLPHRGRRLRRGAGRASALRQSLARRPGGGEPDRLHPDPGTRLAGRQSLQRLAGRRQRTGHVRSRRQRHRAGPDGRREMPVEQVPAGPGRTTLKPGEIVVSFTCRRDRPVRATPISA